MHNFYLQYDYMDVTFIKEFLVYDHSYVYIGVIYVQYIREVLEFYFIQYMSWIMDTGLWFDISRFYPYPSGLLHWHWGNHMIAPVPVK